MGIRKWDGRAVLVQQGDLASLLERRPFSIKTTEDAARKLALLIAKTKQTYFLGLDPEMEELLDALNYVLVADPASVAAHRKMEAGKGMTPDGGFKAPNNEEKHNG